MEDLSSVSFFSSTARHGTRGRTHTLGGSPVVVFVGSGHDGLVFVVAISSVIAALSVAVTVSVAVVVAALAVAVFVALSVVVIVAIVGTVVAVSATVVVAVVVAAIAAAAAVAVVVISLVVVSSIFFGSSFLRGILAVHLLAHEFSQVKSTGFVGHFLAAVVGIKMIIMTLVGDGDVSLPRLFAISPKRTMRPRVSSKQNNEQTTDCSR